MDWVIKDGLIKEFMQNFGEDTRLRNWFIMLPSCRLWY